MTKLFKIYLLCREATKYCLDLLAPLLQDSEQWLEKLVETVQKQGLDSTTVEKSHIEKAAKVSFFIFVIGNVLIIFLNNRNVAEMNMMKILLILLALFQHSRFLNLCTIVSGKNICLVVNLLTICLERAKTRQKCSVIGMPFFIKGIYLFMNNVKV